MIPASTLPTPSLRLAPRLLGLATVGILVGLGCRRSPSEESPSSTKEAASQPATALPAEPQQDALVPVPEGWDPEAFTAAITPTLSKLRKAIESEKAPEGDDFRHALHASFECDRLLPRELEPALELGPLARRRAHVPAATDAAPTASSGESAEPRIIEGDAPSAGESGGPSAPVRERLQGSEGLIAALGDLRALVHQADGVELLLEVVAVEPLPEERATSLLLVQSRGAAPKQFEARWLCTWESFRSHDPWLRSIDLLAYEEVERRTAEPFFADTTEAVLGADPLYETLLLPGLNHWLARLDRGLGGRFFGHHGISVADVDGDGLDDLYVCLNGGLPNRLYVQKPDGTASERSQEAGLDFLDHTQSALFVDFDGDGDQDAAIASDVLVLLRNDGNIHFEPVLRYPSTAAFTSLAAADYDLDGDLDLYACASGFDERDLPDPFFDAHNGPPDMLLRNDGEWRFTDVTAECGLGADNDRFSLSASWSDYDGDGDPDLYVVNDFSHSKLFRNDGGTFHDVAPEAGVRNIAAGHSADWGDANGDGRPDLYVGNVFAPAGHRLSALWSADVGGFSRHELFERWSRGNALYENRGDGTFDDVSEERGVSLGRWAWSSVFTEVDNDGREDLLVANGFVTNQLEEDL